MSASERADGLRDPGPDQSDVDPDRDKALAPAVCRALRVDAIRGVRRPGERLRTEKLEAICGVGPTPPGEALQMPVADARVFNKGDRSFAVAPLDVREVDDIDTARIAVELAALRLSIARGDAASEVEVGAASNLMRKQDDALTRDRATASESRQRADTAFRAALVAVISVAAPRRDAEIACAMTVRRFARRRPCCAKVPAQR